MTDFTIFVKQMSAILTLLSNIEEKVSLMESKMTKIVDNTTARKRREQRNQIVSQEDYD